MSISPDFGSNDNGAIFDMLGTANGGFINNGDNSFVNVAATSHVQDLLIPV